MHEVPSYLATEELVDLEKKKEVESEKFSFSSRADAYLHCDLPLGEVSTDWTQGKMILSFIEISGCRNISRIRISLAACLNLVNGIGRNIQKYYLIF